MCAFHCVNYGDTFTSTLWFYKTNGVTFMLMITILSHPIFSPSVAKPLKRGIIPIWNLIFSSHSDLSNTLGPEPCASHIWPCARAPMILAPFIYVPCARKTTAIHCLVTLAPLISNPCADWSSSDHPCAGNTIAPFRFDPCARRFHTDIACANPWSILAPKSILALDTLH